MVSGKICRIMHFKMKTLQYYNDQEFMSSRLKTLDVICHIKCFCTCHLHSLFDWIRHFKLVVIQANYISKLIFEKEPRVASFLQLELRHRMYKKLCSDILVQSCWKKIILRHSLENDWRLDVKANGKRAFKHFHVQRHKWLPYGAT